MLRHGITLLLFIASSAGLAQQPPDAAPAAPTVKLEYTASDQCMVHAAVTFSPPATVGKSVTAANDMSWAVRRHVKRFENGDTAIKYELITVAGLKGVSLPDGLVATLLANDYVISSTGQASVTGGGRAINPEEATFLLTDFTALTAAENVSLGDRTKGKSISVAGEKVLPLSVIAAHDAELELVYTGTAAAKDEYTVTVQSKNVAAAALRGRLTTSADRKLLHLELAGNTVDTTPFAAAGAELRRDSRTTLRCDRSIE